MLWRALKITRLTSNTVAKSWKVGSKKWPVRDLKGFKNKGHYIFKCWDLVFVFPPLSKFLATRLLQGTVKCRGGAWQKFEGTTNATKHRFRLVCISYAWACIYVLQFIRILPAYIHIYVLIQYNLPSTLFLKMIQVFRRQHRPYPWHRSFLQ